MKPLKKNDNKENKEDKEIQVGLRRPNKLIDEFDVEFSKDFDFDSDDDPFED